MNPMASTRRLFAWNIIIGMAAWLAVAGSAGAAALQSPMESVRNTIAQVIGILTNETLKQPERMAERRRRIEQVVRERVSYEEMAKQTLGGHWLNLTQPERQEFVDLFVQLLRDSFAGKIDAYTDEQVLYLAELREDRVAEVRTKLAGRKIDTLVDFHLADRSGTWLVYDVVIDGASIVRNYRAQFAAIIRDVSYPGLVKRMREKALLVKTFETPVAP
jgi:phospholipid transport system substrate-binding protein